MHNRINSHQAPRLLLVFYLIMLIAPAALTKPAVNSGFIRIRE